MLSEMIKFLGDFHAVVSFGALVASMLNVFALGKVSDLLGGDFGVTGRAFGPAGRGRHWILRRILIYGGILVQLLILGFTVVLIATIPWGVGGKGGTLFSVLMCLSLVIVSIATVVYSFALQ